MVLVIDEKSRNKGVDKRWFVALAEVLFYSLLR
jgi:hypothetical protein